MTSSRLFVKAGTKIRNATGHHVATIVQDIHEGEVVMPSHVEMADGSKPVVGELMPQALIEHLEGIRND